MQQILARIQRYKFKSFWKWFIQHSDEYLNFETNQELLFNKLAERMQKIDPAIVFG